MIGKQGHSVLVTLVERKTRFTVAIKAANKTAQAVTDAICENQKPHQDRVLTLTYLILGTISLAVPTVVTYMVVDPVGPAYVSSLYALSPVLTMTLAAIFGLEGLTARRTFGIALGFVGMVVLIQQKIVGIDFSAMFWVLLGLTVPLGAASGNIIRTAFWPSGASPLSFATATLLISSVLLAIVGPLIESPGTWNFRGEGQVFWLIVLIGTSALSYLLNYTFQKVAGPVVFSQIGYWGTGFGVILAAVLFGDVLRVPVLTGRPFFPPVAQQAQNIDRQGRLWADHDAQAPLAWFLPGPECMRGGAARHFASDWHFHRGIQAEATCRVILEKAAHYQRLVESRSWLAGFFCGIQGIQFVEATTPEVSQRKPSSGKPLNPRVFFV